MDYCEMEKFYMEFGKKISVNSKDGRRIKNLISIFTHISVRDTYWVAKLAFDHMSRPDQEYTNEDFYFNTSHRHYDGIVSTKPKVEDTVRYGMHCEIYHEGFSRDYMDYDNSITAFTIICRDDPVSEECNVCGMVFANSQVDSRDGIGYRNVYPDCSYGILRVGNYYYAVKETGRDLKYQHHPVSAKEFIANVLDRYENFEAWYYDLLSERGVEAVDKDRIRNLYGSIPN